MKKVTHHFAMTLEEMDNRQCPYCHNIDFTPTSGQLDVNKDQGRYSQHEDMEIPDLGIVRIFECNGCHNLILFRSYYTEENELLTKP